MADRLKKPEPTEMCPPGYHVVHGHERICRSGTKTWVDAHIRRNRGKISSGLLVENIHYLFWNAKKSYPSLPQITDFEGKSAEFDALIQFWIDYWKSRGVPFPADLDPLMIKALIAVESTFNEKAVTKVKGSTAAGLMQITDQSLRVLGGFPNKEGWIELRDHLIHVEKADKLDPVVNIALGTRLLGHKFSQIPKKYPKNARGALIGFHSFNAAGEKYADKILEIYENSRTKKKK